MCTANAEEAATATTAGAEHSVVERGAPDLNTTKRTARISDLPRHRWAGRAALRSEEHTSELQSHVNLVCRLLLEKKKRYPLHQTRGRTSRRPTRHGECRSLHPASRATGPSPRPHGSRLPSASWHMPPRATGSPPL